jgi:hypothetical protein
MQKDQPYLCRHLPPLWYKPSVVFGLVIDQTVPTVADTLASPRVSAMADASVSTVPMKCLTARGGRLVFALGV